jgi:hypothetical protein
MKTKILALLSGILLLGVNTKLSAQLSSATAWGLQAGQTTLFGGAKYDLLLVSPEGSFNYQLIGISNPANNSRGTWQTMTQPQGPHSPPPPYYASIGFLDTNYGGQYLVFPANDVFSGQFSAQQQTEFGYTAPFGTNWLATGPAPSSLANHSYFLNITDGGGPFASSGSVIFSPTTTNDYVVFPTSQGIAETHGNYSYALTNAAAGCFTLTDSTSGSSTEYFAFYNAGSGFFMVTQPSGGYEVGNFTVSNLIPTMFFIGQTDLSTNVDWLQFPNGNTFGYYDVMDFGFPCFYHFDMGFEWYFDANNSEHGAYLYDFSSKTFFYTDPQTFPNLYDFTLKSWIYYFPDPNQAGHYTSKPRYFYNYETKRIITK